MNFNSKHAWLRLVLLGLVLGLFQTKLFADELSVTAAADKPNWTHWPSDPNFFPISVWVQDPRNAAKYKAVGINLFVGLWEGPTEDQLAALSKAEMPVICGQNAVGLKHLDDPIIYGWMHGDEPDNAQSLPGGKGYGPPILPAKIVKRVDRRTIKIVRPSGR